MIWGVVASSAVLVVVAYFYGIIVGIKAGHERGREAALVWMMENA